MDAVELKGEARERYLDAECRDDQHLKSRVRELLVAAEGSSTFLGTPDVAMETSPSPPHGDDNVGTAVDRYKLVEVLGEGGFGRVYRAEQEQPLRRTVAIKIVKLGMDTRAVVARFELERQVLSSLDHPNIAKVLDAGTTQHGRPYFVMDYVDGKPIDAYCDAHSLGIDARMELFAQVCEAVQHAHARGLIHRDIKPSNVLVAERDGRPQVKVIDFGIAKAIASPGEAVTTIGEHNHLIGTPEYMSPEQAEGSRDIDTRTDVYSLGALLYVLLTGSPPFESTMIRPLPLAEIQRTIRDVEPARPSTRVVSSSSDSESIAARRRCTPKELASTLKGELDWVVAKSLEKDRNRRYTTAHELATDVGRFLRREVLTAVPPTRIYLASKFVRKHRGQVAAAALVILVLVLGAAGTTWGFITASKRADSEKAAKDKAQAAEKLAEEREQDTFQVASFQRKVLTQINPGKAGRELFSDLSQRFETALAAEGVPEEQRAKEVETMRAYLARINATDAAQAMIDRVILTPAIGIIDKDFASQELVSAALRHGLAELYEQMGLFKSAEPLLVNALEIRRRLLGSEHHNTMSSMNNLASLHLNQSRYEEAESLLVEILATRRKLEGDDDEDTIRSIHDLGRVYQHLGKTDLAVKCGREATERAARVFGKDDPGTLAVVNTLAGYLQIQGELSESEALLLDTLERRKRTTGPDSAAVSNTMRELAFLYEAMGQFRKAESMLRNVLAQREKVLGTAHPRTLDSRMNLGLILQRHGQLVEAELIMREALASSIAALGGDHADSLKAKASLASVLTSLGRSEEAEPLARDALAVGKRTLRSGHPEVLKYARTHAATLSSLGRFEESVALLREFRGTAVQELGPDADITIVLSIALGAQLRDLGHLDEAEPLLIDAAARSTDKLVATSQITLGCARELAMCRSARGAHDEAATSLRTVLETSRGIEGDAHPETLSTIACLAEVLLAKGDATEVETLSLPAVTAAIELFQPGQRVRERLIESLANALDARAKAEPGQGHEARAAEWRSKLKASPK